MKITLPKFSIFDKSKEESDNSSNVQSHTELQPRTRIEPERKLKYQQVNHTERLKITEAYQKNRFYHGTTESSKESIRANGFTASHKQGGATSNSFGAHEAQNSDEPFFQNARKYNYLTSNPTVASQYAILATEADRPAIVRALYAPTERDPDSSAHDDSFRTKKDIQSKYIVGSKRQAASRAEGKVFQSILKNNGVKVSIDEAGVLLREEQTDSEDEVERMRPFLEERATFKEIIEGKR